MQTKENFFPVPVLEGQSVDSKPTKENRSNGTLADEAAPVHSTMPTALASASPLSDILGKYEGEEWDEFQAILKRNRQDDDANAGKE